MKPYKKARIIEIIAIVLAIAVLLIGMNAGFIERFGSTGTTIARIAAIVIALIGIIASRKYSKCPHCGKTINALSRYCPACGRKLSEEPGQQE